MNAHFKLKPIFGLRRMKPVTHEWVLKDKSAGLSSRIRYDARHVLASMDGPPTAEESPSYKKFDTIHI
jgi:hypothetical protein